MAVVLGALLLPVASGGGAARATWDTLIELAPKQRQHDDAERPSRVAADAERTQAQKHPKMDSSTALVARAAGGRGTQNPVDVARARDVTVVDDALIRVIVESAGAPAQAAAAVRAAGGTVEAEYRDLIQALVAPVMLEALALDPAVKYVRQPARPQTDGVLGEGVAASGASYWQADGYIGQNVKVGVIDLGFTGYQTRQGQGDLPPTVTTVDFCSGQFNAAGGEHGTAVAEVVYEMAPGVQLYLLCIGTEVQLGQAKDYAKANGISILVMSISWFNTSRGDGSGSPSSPNMTVADARANGILWVNAAGNRAQQHYGSVFSDTDGGGNGSHNFAPVDNGNTVQLAPGQGICVFLRWDNWPVTSQDFDLYLFRQGDLTTPVAYSEALQTGSQPPTEAFCYANGVGSTQYFSIYVEKYSANSNPYFELFLTPGPNLEYQTAAGSVTEPASSPNAMAVGAICWQTSRLEDYSSQGPTIDGRTKPDIAGQTVVSSSSYPGAVSCPGGSNGTGGFNGTSAAAPHVAGAAALVKGANPSFTPAQIQSFLEVYAVDLGPGGKDNLYGAGKLLLGVSPLPPPVCSPRPRISVQPTISGGRQNVTVSVSGTNNRLLSIGFSSGAAVPVNALLDLPDGRTSVTGTPTWTAGAGATQTTFFVRRQNPGASVTVPFTVEDRCGSWRTFVGAGAGAPGF